MTTDHEIDYAPIEVWRHIEEEAYRWRRMIEKDLEAENG